MQWLLSAWEAAVMHHDHDTDDVVLRETLVDELELCFSLEAKQRLKIGDVQVSLLANVI